MRFSWITSLALVLLAAPLAAGVATPASKISPELARALADSPDGRAEMLVVLAEQADLSGAHLLGSKLERGRYVFERLSETAQRTQAPLLAELERLGAPHRAFWVANFVWTKGDFALASRLAARDEVARIDANPRMVLQEPVLGPGDFDGPAAPNAIEWNITKVNAPQVWALGYTGQGAVIAGQDTGYEWNHPALINKYRGWNGASADHNYNWHDAIHSGGGSCGANTTAPCDDYGHGTHTMGTMVGDDGGTHQIGMAPGAKWIGCRNMDVGVGTPATYSECFQWFIAPTNLANQNPNPALAPDVISNSWGCPPSEGCTTPDILRTVVESTRAAGIFVSVSAGNAGSSCSTVEDPPAIYDASFTVGSTTSSDAISSFSSRGPVTVDGSNRMKPDISAPGSNVTSSVPGGGYGSNSGTSMASPHVGGLVGLLISAVPGAAGDVDRLENVIRDTAFHPSFGGECGVGAGVFPNNTFGSGRIDALAAVNLLLSQAGFSVAATPASESVCAPADATYDVAIGQFGGFTDPVTLSVAGNPAGTTVDFSVNPVTPPGASTLTVGNTGAAAPGAYPLTITGTAPGPTSLDTGVELRIFAAAAGSFSLTAPANAASNVPVRPAFTWTAAANAADYLLEVDDDSNFSSPVYTATVAGTTHTPGADLPSNTVLFWRVTANNPCGSTVAGVFHFTTVALPGDCALGTVPDVLYDYGFEAGASGWTHSGTGDSWAISTANPHGGTSSFHANDPGSVSDQRLVSPGVPLPVGENPLVLVFWHVPDLEPSGASACYDGGILELSTNGGSTWTQVPAASLLDGSYTGAVSSCCSNPLAGLQAWCGTAGYIRTVADLSAYAGQTVMFRLRLGSDSSVSEPGWHVDDVRVQGCLADSMPFLDGFESGDTSAWSATQP